MPQQESENKRNRLNRLRDLFSSSRGDTVVANIGDNARDVIVGKNIIKIGKLQVPTLPVVVTLLAAIVVSALAAWFFFVPDKMTGAFKVAVADFGEVDAQGRLQNSENGAQLSRWVFDALTNELDTLPRELRQSLGPQVWHDSLWPLTTRTRIGVIPDDATACRRAEEIGADIIIYGNLGVNQDTASFTPRLCILINKDRDELDDIIGNHELGKAVSLRLPLTLSKDPVARLAVNDKMVNRINAISRLTIGLLYDLIGDQDTALGILQSAETEVKWDERDGKEVLYYFIGKQKYYLKQVPEARAAFQKALSLNPNYARAHIGLGTTYYAEAQDLAAPSDRLKTDHLDKMFGEYKRALTLARQQSDPRLELTTHFALGTGYRLAGEAHLFANDYGPANSFYDLAVQEFQTGLKMIDPTQNRLLVHAYLGIATAYQQKAHIRLVQGDRAGSRGFFEQASGYYDRCIKAADAAPHDQFLTDQIKNAACVPYKKDVDQALSDLR